MRRSNEGKLKGSGGGSGSNSLRASGEGSLSGAAPKASKVTSFPIMPCIYALFPCVRSSANPKNAILKHEHKQGYDYSKVPASFVGALPTNQAAVAKEEAGRSGSSGRAGGKNNKQKKGNNANTLTSSANPYLFGSSVNK